MTEYRRRHCDVLVIGGGSPASRRRCARRRPGADVVLVDDDIEPGGRLLAEGERDQARDLAPRGRAAGVEILARAPALGYFDGLVPVWQGDTLHQVRAARHVAATARSSSRWCSPNNDLPGVMLCGGARRLAALYGVAPGTAARGRRGRRRGLDDALALHGPGSASPRSPICGRGHAGRGRRAPAPPACRVIDAARRSCARRATAA